MSFLYLFLLTFFTLSCVFVYSLVCLCLTFLCLLMGRYNILLAFVLPKRYFTHFYLNFSIFLTTEQSTDYIILVSLFSREKHFYYPSLAYFLMYCNLSSILCIE